MNVASTAAGQLKSKISVPPAVKKALPHLLVVGLFFALVAKLLTLIQTISAVSLALTASLLVLGSLHVWAMYRFQAWAQGDEVWKEVVFTFVANLLGGLVLLVFCAKNEDLTAFAAMLFCATWTFSLPFYLYLAIIYHTRIPEKVYSPFIISDEWSAKASMAFDVSNLGIVWRFQQDEYGDLPQGDERIFAPQNMGEINFGALFGAYLLWHNTQLRPDQPIRVNRPGQPGLPTFFRWEFYHRRHWFSLWRSRIDPTLTVRQNRLHFRVWRSKMDTTLRIMAPLIIVRRAAVAAYHTENQSFVTIDDSF